MPATWLRGSTMIACHPLACAVSAAATAAAPPPMIATRLESAEQGKSVKFWAWTEIAVARQMSMDVFMAVPIGQVS